MMNPSKLGVFAVLAISTLTAGSAAADNCKSVDIKVSNAQKEKIRTRSMQYEAKVDNKLRSESIPNVEVGAGKTVLVASNQNLEYIEGYDMKTLKLTYDVFCGSGSKGKWIGPFTATDTKFLAPKCTSNNGKTYTINIPANEHCSR